MSSAAEAAVCGLEWPICPACRKPLENNLVASRCNHVFHKDCLYGLQSIHCPKCGEENPCMSALDLYMSFGEASNDKVNQGEGELDKESEEKIEKLLDGRDVSRDKRKEAEKLADRRGTFRERCDHQEQKHAMVQKAAAKLGDKKAKQQKELEKYRERYDTMQESLRLSRQRDAVFEYRDTLQNKGEEDAQIYLSRMASFVDDPAMIVTDVARLRDHHKAQNNKTQKDCMLVAQRMQKGRREKEEKESQLAVLQKKLRMSREEVERLAASLERKLTGKSREDVGSGGRSNEKPQSSPVARAPSRTLTRSFSNSSIGGESLGGASIASSFRPAAGLAANLKKVSRQARPLSQEDLEFGSPVDALEAASAAVAERLSQEERVSQPAAQSLANVVAEPERQDSQPAAGTDAALGTAFTTGGLPQPTTSPEHAPPSAEQTSGPADAEQQEQPAGKREEQQEVRLVEPLHLRDGVAKRPLPESYLPSPLRKRAHAAAVASEGCPPPAAAPAALPVAHGAAEQAIPAGDASDSDDDVIVQID